MVLSALATLRRRPVTIVLAVLSVVLTIVNQVVVRAAISPLGLSQNDLPRRDLLPFLTSDVIASSVAELVVVVVAILLGVGWAEGAMGSIRTAWVFVVTGISAAAVGLLAQVVASQVDEYWARQVGHDSVFDPFAPIVGTLACASAFAPLLWRRRIRVALIAIAAAFLLYSGRPEDLYLLIALLVGMLLGSRLARPARPDEAGAWRRSSSRETRLLLALVVVVLAIGPVISVLTRSSLGVLSPLGLSEIGIYQGDTASCGPFRAGQGCSGNPHAVRIAGSVLVSVLPIVALLIVARGLAAGRRAALWLAAAFGVVTAFLGLYYFIVLPATDPDAERLPRNAPELIIWSVATAAVPLALAVAAVLNRRAFPVRTTRRSVAIALTIVLGALALVSALYLAGASALAAQFTPRPSFADLLADLPERLLPGLFLRLEQQAFRPQGFPSVLLYRGIGPLFWAAVIVAVSVLLRRPREESGDPSGAAHLRDALREGSGTIGFMATWPGNTLWRDAETGVVVAYRVLGGVAVTLGDPIGRRRRDPGVLQRFIAFCEDNAWTPAFYSVHDDVAQPLRDQGWSDVVVADETVLDPAGWQLEGRAFKDIRTAVSRARRDGLRVRLDRWSDLPLRIRSAVIEASEQWVAEKKLPELGFTLGGVDELDDPDVLVALALTEDDRVVAATSWLPVWEHGRLIGRTLDFMRRLPGAANGTMEFLIAETMSRFREDGLGIASLSGAPLAVTPDDVPDALDRVLALIGRRLEPAYGFRSLFTFKRKFQPRHEPLHLVVRDPLSLPAVGLAVARAYLPDLGLRESAQMLRALR